MAANRGGSSASVLMPSLDDLWHANPPFRIRVRVILQMFIGPLLSSGRLLLLNYFVTMLRFGLYVKHNDTLVINTTKDPENTHIIKFFITTIPQLGLLHALV
jgi:hypothetical protein